MRCRPLAGGRGLLVFLLIFPKEAAVRCWAASGLGRLVFATMGMLAAAGCASVTGGPSNHRDWRPEFAVLAEAEVDGEQVTVKNIRNCSYLSEDVYVVDHYDKTFDLDQLQSVDYIVVPFKEAPALAHTLLSFGFQGPDGDQYVAVSVEARLENNESYSPLTGAAQKFELMYVVADERDVLRLRTEFRDVDVYVYRVRATPQQVRSLFLDVMQRVNRLARKPEFYDTLSNNCTNNIVRHINKLRPGRVPWDPRITFPGLSDQLAYDLGLLDITVPFAELKQRAHINAAAKQAAALPDFSNRIRR
jgi:hypothetical protein